MPETSLATALTAAVMACTFLLAPGWLALRFLRIRGLLALAVAPSVSTATLGAGAVVAGALGIRWGIAAALGSVALGLLVAWFLGRRWNRQPQHARTPRLDVLAIAVGLAIAITSTATAIGSLESYLQRRDVVFHLSALQQIAETGDASSLTLGSLAYGDGHPAPYPSGWHALASLLPGPTTATLTIAALLAAVIPWVLGCAALAGELVRRDERVLGLSAVGIAALLAAVATAGPISLWIGWGHIPNAAGLAMLPGIVALGLRTIPDRPARPPLLAALAVALVGAAFAHPNAALAALILLGVALAGVLLRGTRNRWARGRRRLAVLVPAVVIGAAVIVGAVFWFSPVSGAVIDYAGGRYIARSEAIGDLAVGHYRLWSPEGTGLVLALLGTAGAVVLAVRRQWLGTGMLAAAWLLYIDAASGGRLLISRLWYTSTARLSVVVVALVVPLAAVAVLALARKVADLVAGARGTATARQRVGQVLALGLAASLVFAVAAPALTVRAALIPPRFATEPGNPPQFVTTGELAMIGDLPELDGVVLGSPLSGAASAYGLAGTRVVFHAPSQVWSADQALVMANLDVVAGAATNPEVCAALERLEIRYLYQDSIPYEASTQYGDLDTLEVSGAVVIAQGDTARIVQLPPCES